VTELSGDPGLAFGPAGMSWSWAEETVYLGLCRNGKSSVEDLARTLELAPDEVLRALLGLRIKGLAHGPEIEG
jgi:hypothetical protein